MQQFINELKAKAKEITSQSSIEDTTMKQIMIKVADNYNDSHPGLLNNATYKKAIKDAVKEVLALTTT